MSGRVMGGLLLGMPALRFVESRRVVLNEKLSVKEDSVKLVISAPNMSNLPNGYLLNRSSRIVSRTMNSFIKPGIVSSLPIRVSRTRGVVESVSIR